MCRPPNGTRRVPASLVTRPIFEWHVGPCVVVRFIGPDFGLDRMSAATTLMVSVLAARPSVPENPLLGLCLRAAGGPLPIRTASGLAV